MTSRGLSAVEHVGAEAEPVEHAGPEVLQQHVGPAHQLGEHGLVGVVLEVEGDRLLVAVAPTGSTSTRGRPSLAAARTAAPSRGCRRRVPGLSTLITRAPRSPSIIAACGPARARVRSTTRMPVEGSPAVRSWAGSVRSGRAQAPLSQCGPEPAAIERPASRPTGVTTAVTRRSCGSAGSSSTQLVVEDQGHQDGVGPRVPQRAVVVARRPGPAGCPSRATASAGTTTTSAVAASPSAPSRGPTGSSSPNRPGASRPVSTAQRQLGARRRGRPGAAPGRRAG